MRGQRFVCSNLGKPFAAAHFDRFTSLALTAMARIEPLREFINGLCPIQRLLACDMSYVVVRAKCFFKGFSIHDFL